jgi:2-oxoglutarate dehydrogenase E2 component (dihydrolipoamide succinyltransferase)
MAVSELVMPKMGESIMEATILRWHKKVGDYVKMDETILDIATDKVDSEVPSTAEGIIKHIWYNVNDVVPVGNILCTIESQVFVPVEIPTPVTFEPTQVEEFVPTVQTETIYHQSSHEQPVYNAPPPQEFIPFVPATNEPVISNNNRFFSPLVLNIANSEGLSLSELERIVGTGADGRVSKKDVLQYIADKRAGRVPVYAPQPAPQQYYTAPTDPVATMSVAQDYTAPISSTLSVPVREEEVVHHKEEINFYPIAETAVAATESVSLELTPTVEAHIPTEEEAVIDAVVAEAHELITTNEVETSVEDAIAEMEASSFASAETASDLNVETPIEQTPALEVAELDTPLQIIPQSKVVEEPVFDASKYKNAEIVEMDRMRKLIAKHMVDSKATSPHVTSFTEADVTNMVTWRSKIKDEFEKREGMKITFTPMFIECVLKVMKHYPIINSSVVGDKIIMKKDFNIGMATALPSGNLIVPVIKNAADMNFISLTRNVNTLADNARQGKLAPDDVMDGTFTFTNVGTFGSLMGTPIINQPQVAILAVGEIKKRPVVVETDKGDFIGIRHMMYLSLSYDHRIIDGSIGASFLSDVAKELEAWDVNRQLKYVVKEWYVE